jgi:hypothetical protein
MGAATGAGVAARAGAATGAGAAAGAEAGRAAVLPRTDSRMARTSTGPPNSADQLSSTERSSIRNCASTSSTQPALIPKRSR